MRKLKIAISTGELSGDEHAKSLILALKKIGIDADVRGMGGHNMREVGAITEVDSEKSASVMGFGDVLFAFKKIKAALNQMKKFLTEWKPDVLILIDYPDFNFRLAKHAKKLGIKVFYFIPPQVWAWRSGRVEFLKKYVDACAVIFPHEENFLKENGYDNVKFIGHPFVEQLSKRTISEEEKKAFLNEYKIDVNKPILAVLAGSRKSEIKKHITPVIETLKVLLEKHSEVQPVIAVAPTIKEDVFDEFMKKPITDSKLPITIIKGHSVELMQCATAGFLKSGTSNMQAAVCGLPFMMFFVAPILAEIILKTVSKISQYSIVNNVRPNSVMEFLQQDVDHNIMSAELEKLLYDEKYREQIKKNIKAVKDDLEYHGNDPLFTDCKNASERVAKAIEFLCV